MKCSLTVPDKAPLIASHAGRCLNDLVNHDVIGSVAFRAGQ